MSKIMLVCSKRSEEVEKCLRSAGGEIVIVNDGEAAIVQAQHAIFNMAILVSTGKTMDLAETVFNLRDINSSMPILLIDEPRGAGESEAEIIAHASRNTRALTVADLPGYLGLVASPARRRIGNRDQQKTRNSDPSR